MPAATGHAIRINTNMQVLNYFNSKAKAFLKIGTWIIYLPIPPNSLTKWFGAHRNYCPIERKLMK
jgi:hypothetical protein